VCLHFVLLFFFLCVVFCLSCGREKTHTFRCVYFISSHLIFSSSLHIHIHIIILFFSYRSRSCMYRRITALTINDRLQKRRFRTLCADLFWTVCLNHLLVIIRQSTQHQIHRSSHCSQKDHPSTRFETPPRNQTHPNCRSGLHYFVEFFFEMSQKAFNRPGSGIPQCTNGVCPSICREISSHMGISRVSAVPCSIRIKTSSSQEVPSRHGVPQCSRTWSPGRSVPQPLPFDFQSSNSIIAVPHCLLFKAGTEDPPGIQYMLGRNPNHSSRLILTMEYSWLLLGDLRIFDRTGHTK